MNDFLAREFIHGFLEESDELLQAIHDHLLALEHHLSSPDPDFDPHAVVAELLRAFHTLKGLAGMVELSSAADLAHEIESVLHRTMRDRTPLTAEGVESLLAASRALETSINTLRDPQSASPDVTDIERRLSALSTGTTSPPAGTERAADDTLQAELASILPSTMLDALTAHDLDVARRRRTEGAHLMFARFRPTPELLDRGVSVNAARAHMEARGQVLKGVPLIAEGRVEFGFLVALPPGAEALALEGLEWTPMPTLPATSAEEPHAPTPSWSFEGRRGVSDTVRVEIARLDEVMRLVGDLVVSRARLQAVIEQMEAEGISRPALTETSQKLERQLRSLRDTVVRARMVPLAQVFGRMPLAVRDLARQYGREVQLVLEGSETQVDKLLVERLLEPMMHLVRNAIAHGIESPQARKAAGKPSPATLTIRGQAEGDNILICVEDDGAGIDLERVAARARERGWQGEGRDLDGVGLLDIITSPGFSTRSAADQGAGRGMGMDVVARAVRSVSGRLDVVTRAGGGTRFTIRLPLTLAIIDAFIVQVEHEQYAVPRSAIDHVVEVERDQVVRAPRGELLPWRGTALPLVRLAPLFGLPSSERGVGLVHGTDARARALVVDRVVGLREVVVTSISDPLLAQDGIAGATELGDGRVALIVDVPAVVRRGLEGPPT